MITAALEALYAGRRGHPWSINEHMDTLRRYARECDHIVEFGVDCGFSTIAFLAGLADSGAAGKRLEGWDLRRAEADIALIERHAAELGIEYTLHVGSSLAADFTDCDLLFIDSLHTYAHLKAELFGHANKARRWLVLHDTVGGADTDEGGGEHQPQGLAPAIAAFRAGNPHWELAEMFWHQYGLSVYARRG